MWEYEHSVETSAPARGGVAALVRLPAWPSWNAGIEKIPIDGPFQAGTAFTMTPPGEEPVPMRLTEVVPGELFTDEMDAGDFVVRTVHRLTPVDRRPHPDHLPHRDHRPGRRPGGPELGPAITADFPDVLAALAALAEGDQAVPLEPEESPGLLLWHVTLRWQRDMAAVLAPLDLTHVQFVLLATTWWLNSRGQHPNQLALAHQAGTDVKMTSQVLRTLEAKV